MKLGKLYFLTFILQLLLSCQSEIDINSYKNINEVKVQFSATTNYIYDPKLIQLSNGVVKLKEVDQFHSSDDFKSGTNSGSSLNLVNNLSLSSNNPSLLSITDILPDRVPELIGYWPMDNSSNDLTGLNATNENGSLGYSKNSKLGGHSLELDGTNDYLSFATTFHNSFTVSMWVRYSEFDAKEGLIDGGGDAWFDSYIDTSGEPYFWSRDSDFVQTQLISSKAIKQNEWSHIIFVLGPQGNKIYVDGTLSASTTRNIANGNFISIGKSTTYFGKQLMDEVAIWNTELSETEILKIHSTQSQKFSNDLRLSSNWTPKWNDIIGYWNMDENSMDSSTYANHAYATGNVNFSSAGKINGTAANLNGIDGQLQISTLDGYFNVDNGTISCWVKNEFPIADTQSRYLFRYIDVDGNGIGLRFMSTNTVAYNYTGAGSFVTAYKNNWEENIPRDEWIHIATTWDISGEGKIRLYYNGIEVASEDQSIPASNNFSSFRFGYGTNGFKGKLDECAIWKSTLNQGEVNHIYNFQKQAYAGVYESPILNLGKSGTWSTLTPLTPIPFMKELTPNTGNESSLDYAQSGTGLIDDLIGYWTMSETTTNSAPSGTDLEDTSVNQNHFLESGSVKLNTHGILDSGIILDGTDDYLTAPNNISLDISSDLTLSIWMKSTGELADTGVFGGLIGKTNFVGSVSYGLRVYNSSYEFLIRQSDGTYIRSRKNLTPKIVDGKWHHLVGVANSTEGSLKLYIDGVLQTDSIDLTWDGTLASTSYDLIIGRDYADEYFKGSVDEAALWDRPLSAVEITELYRRSANRLKYQVRSCNDNSCDTEPFIGPSGTNETYFSELSNNSLININGKSVGNQLASKPSFIFNDFVWPLVDNQFFQYRILFESEENQACSGDQCMPEVSSIDISPSGRVYEGEASVTTKTPLKYNQIDSLVIKENGDCLLKYQLSLDSNQFYYWNGSTWAKTVTSKNTKSTTTSMIRKFSNQFGPGDLYIKVFFEGNSNKACTLEGISLFNKK